MFVVTNAIRTDKKEKDKKIKHTRDRIYNEFKVHLHIRTHIQQWHLEYVCHMRFFFVLSKIKNKNCDRCTIFAIPDHIVSGVGFTWFQFSFLHNWYVWAGFWIAITSKHWIRWDNNRFGEIWCCEFLSKYNIFICGCWNWCDVGICERKVKPQNDWYNRPQCLLNSVEVKYKWLCRNE